jgi:hypothetical protein
MKTINRILGWFGFAVFHRHEMIFERLVTAQNWLEREAAYRRRIASLSANLSYHRRQLALARKGVK